MNVTLRFLSVGFCAFLLASCIEFEQEIDLKSDGSGEFEMEISVPDMGSGDDTDTLMSDEEAEAQAEASGVEILENSTSKANGKITTTLRVAFDDMEELNTFMQKEDEEGNKDMSFQFSLEKNGGESTLRHQVTPEETKDEEGEKDSEMGELMLANMLKDSYYVVRWSLPGEVTDATGEANIEGNKVDFKIPMIAMMKGSGVDVSATYKSGTPAWIFLAIGGVVLLLVIIFLARFLRKS